MRLEKPKPAVSYYHYSNSDSQGALICETDGFPDSVPVGMEYNCAYSDRIASWDYEKCKKACELAGGGDQVWAYRLPNLTIERLREFAKVALFLPTLPVHIRVIHWYNVSNGYSCPTVEAIYDPKNDASPGGQVSRGYERNCFIQGVRDGIQVVSTSY